MKKRILSSMMAFVMMLSLLPMSAFAVEAGFDSFKKVNDYQNDTFTDVSDNDWFAENVQAVFELGLMIGQSKEKFGPNGDVTIAESVTVAARLHAIYTNGAESFTQGDPWYQVYADYLTENKLFDLEGLDLTAPATRAQFAGILGSAFPAEALKAINTIGDDAIPDVKTGDPYADTIYTLYRAGVLTGNDDKGTFLPTTPIKRSEVAAIVTRMAQPDLRKDLPFGEKIENECAVTFELNYTNGGTYNTIKVEKGKTITLPAAPSRIGYNFNGWFTAATGGKQFDVKETVSEDITLYAHWNVQGGGGGGGSHTPVIKNHTVTFDLNYDGAPEAKKVTVKDGDSVTALEKPVRESYSFIDWYTDQECKTAYDFSLPVKTDITLYAGWRPNTDNLSDDIIDRGDIEELMANGTIETIFDDNGQVQTIIGPFTTEKVKNEETAANVLNSAASLFGEEFYVSPEDITYDSVGEGTEKESFYRTSMTIDGIPVLGSEIILSTDKSDNVTGLFSTYDNRIYQVDPYATLSQEEAEEIVIDDLFTKEKVALYIDSLIKEGQSLEKVKEDIIKECSFDTELVIYSDNEDFPYLVYRILVSSEHVTSSPALGLSYVYYVIANDEQEGKIAVSYNNTRTDDIQWKATVENVKDYYGNLQQVEMKTGYSGSTQMYELADLTRNIETHDFAEYDYKTGREIPGGSITTISPAQFSGEQVSMHINMSKVYDFYTKILGRKSYDGEGIHIITNIVAEKYNYNNACYSPSLDQFFFSIGSNQNNAIALDTVAHEFTHAVTDRIVDPLNKQGGFSYYTETGAISEFYSDIMGSIIEGKSDEGRWLVGEDSGKAIRSLSSPSSFFAIREKNVRYPDHYSAVTDPKWKHVETGWLNDFVDRDNGGVHIFSNILNYAAYKMMTDQRTNGISYDTWGKVFYHSVFRLQINSQFVNARGGIIASAKSLGFTQEQQQAIKDAFDAVGIVEPDSIRIVLKWGATPSDLDSHLVGPGIKDGERFHTAYYQRSYYQNGTYDSSDSVYAVDLDYDDTTSYGPEVTTIYKFTPGDYYFFVHDYSNGSSDSSTEMAKSGATVSVQHVKNGTSERINSRKTFNIEPSSSGTIWNVFKLTIHSDKSIDIEEINTYGASESYS